MTRTTLLALASKLPAGITDPLALKKLYRERSELYEEIGRGDEIGVLLECADCLYYCTKSVHNSLLTQAQADEFMRGVEAASGFTSAQIEQAAIIKYTMRARPGNPKDDKAERAAVAHLI